MLVGVEALAIAGCVVLRGGAAWCLWCVAARLYDCRAVKWSVGQV